MSKRGRRETRTGSSSVRAVKHVVLAFAATFTRQKTEGCEATNEVSNLQIEAFSCQVNEGEGNVFLDLVPAAAAGPAA